LCQNGNEKEYHFVFGHFRIRLWDSSGSTSAQGNISVSSTDRINKYPDEFVGNCCSYCPGLVNLGVLVSKKTIKPGQSEAEQI